MNIYYLKGYKTILKVRDYIGSAIQIKEYLDQYFTFDDYGCYCEDAVIDLEEQSDGIYARCIWHIKEIEIVLEINRSSTYLDIKRIILNMYLQILANKGASFIHASAVEYNNKAIIILGNHHSGKTTTLLQLLESGKTNFITNDKLVLLKENEEDVILGVPSRIMVRDISVSNLKKLAQYYSNNKKIELDAENRICFDIRDICKYYNCKVVPTSKKPIFLFVEYNKDIEFKIVELSKKEAILKILQLKVNPSYDNRITDLFSSQVFISDISGILSNYKHFFLIIQNSNNSKRIKQICDELK